MESSSSPADVDGTADWVGVGAKARVRVGVGVGVEVRDDVVEVGVGVRVGLAEVGHEPGKSTERRRPGCGPGVGQLLPSHRERERVVRVTALLLTSSMPKANRAAKQC